MEHAGPGQPPDVELALSDYERAMRDGTERDILAAYRKLRLAQLAVESANTETEPDPDAAAESDY